MNKIYWYRILGFIFTLFIIYIVGAVFFKYGILEAIIILLLLVDKKTKGGE